VYIRFSLDMKKNSMFAIWVSKWLSDRAYILNAMGNIGTHDFSSHAQLVHSYVSSLQVLIYHLSLFGGWKLKRGRGCASLLGLNCKASGLVSFHFQFRSELGKIAMGLRNG